MAQTATHRRQATQWYDKNDDEIRIYRNKFARHVSLFGLPGVGEESGIYNTKFLTDDISKLLKNLVEAELDPLKVCTAESDKEFIKSTSIAYEDILPAQVEIEKSLR